jgi:hypothetical protein
MPGLLLGIEVRNEAVVRKALDRAMQLADEASREGRGSGETMFSRLAHGGAEYVRIEIPEEESPIPLHPAFALRGGYFLVSSETDVLLASLDAGDGKGKRFADSPVFQRATAAVGTKCTTAELVDWGRLVDQVAEYAPQMGGVFAGADVPYPEPPADGNEAEWERRQEEYRAKMMEARAGGGAKAKAWIESFRVIDFIGATVRTTGEMMESVVVVKFAE